MPASILNRNADRSLLNASCRNPYTNRLFALQYARLATGAVRTFTITVLNCPILKGIATGIAFVAMA